MRKKATFTKVKKWAEKKRYSYTEHPDNEDPSIYIRTDNQICFDVSDKTGSLYRSRSGTLKGTYTGLHLAVTNYNLQRGKYGYSFSYRSQEEIIKEMEKVMEHQLKQESLQTKN